MLKGNKGLVGQTDFEETVRMIWAAGRLTWHGKSKGWSSSGRALGIARPCDRLIWILDHG